MNKNKRRNVLIVDLILLVLCLALDQGTKYLAVLHLKEQPSLPIIRNVLELVYLENRGAAFGMLQNQKIFILFVAVTFLAVVIYSLYKMPAARKYYPLHFLLTAVSAGAAGNMIDRIRLDYVVDFIYFAMIDFPVFNVADIYVSVGTVILVIFLLFVYKEEDFAFLNFKQKKYREVK